MTCFDAEQEVLRHLSALGSQAVDTELLSSDSEADCVQPRRSFSPVSIGSDASSEDVTDECSSSPHLQQLINILQQRESQAAAAQAVLSSSSTAAYDGTQVHPP